MDEKLKTLNSKIFDHYLAFEEYFEKRKTRLLQYSLIKVIKDLNLALPTFSTNSELVLREAKLPALANLRPESYVALNLALNRGTNVLFGANMSGKTTALKTVFFHLTLIKMGLPIPAQSATLNFPELIMILLTGSGDMSKNLSTFGEEINFFCNKFPPGAYVLVDELFHSTNPISGAELSTIFLEEFKNQDLVFFCNTHYAQVLSISDISLFRMKDVWQTDAKTLNFDNPDFIESDLTLDDLMGKIPYEVEAISKGDIDKALIESKKPLYIALHFPLATKIKQRIQKLLKG